MSKNHYGDYCNNDSLYTDICRWYKTQCPRSWERIGAAVLAIAEGNVKRWQFNRYDESLKEQMVGDSVLICIKALRNRSFDTTCTNPFAYLTSCCYWACVGIITKLKEDCTAKAHVVRSYMQEHQPSDPARISFLENLIEGYAPPRAPVKVESVKPIPLGKKRKYRVSEERARRDLAIYHAHKDGASYDHLANVHKLAAVSIRRIVYEQGAHLRRLAEQQLFTEQQQQLCAAC